MEKPKDRRKNYRLFQNFDLIKFKDNWFVRFPNEREHIHISDDKAAELMRRVYVEAEKLKKDVTFSDPRTGEVIAKWPTYPPDVDMRPFVTAQAKELLS